MQYLKLFSVDTKIKFIFLEKIYSTADLCINFKKPTYGEKKKSYKLIASLITTILISSGLGITVIYPIYPQHLHFFLLHPYKKLV